jgi:hypothetical protein
MLTTIKNKFTAAWKAHAAAVGAGAAAYLLAQVGLAPEPDPAAVGAAVSGLGEIAFSVISGIGAWLATYFAPANTAD